MSTFLGLVGTCFAASFLFTWIAFGIMTRIGLFEQPHWLFRWWVRTK